MPARTPVIAANWKMHKTRPETSAFLDASGGGGRAADGRRARRLPSVHRRSRRRSSAVAGTEITVAAQNMHFEPQGAFTGELSAPMLVEVGVDAVVLGHSERRQLFAETDEALARKVPAALRRGADPDPLRRRDAGRPRGGANRGRARAGQVEEDLADVGDGDLARIVIAYEPVWAIGTGRNATADQAAEAIAFIRSLVAARDQARGRGGPDPLRRIGQARQRRRACSPRRPSTARWSGARASTRAISLKSPLQPPTPRLRLRSRRVRAQTGRQGPSREPRLRR